MADSATASEDRGYLYDAAWNLNKRTNNTTVTTFTVDTMNQLTNVTAIGTRGHDGNGNVTNSGSVSYEYDAENQLVILSSPAAWKYTFTYDGRGRLRTKGKEIWSGGQWVSVSEVEYVYDGMRVIQERQWSDWPYEPVTSYTRGTDLSGSLEGAGGIGGLLSRSSGDNVNWTWASHAHYQADGNGNITYLVNSSQTTAATYRCDPYGNTISSSGSLAGLNTYRA